MKDKLRALNNDLLSVRAGSEKITPDILISFLIDIADILTEISNDTEDRYYPDKFPAEEN